jgi:hypothetical protein
MTELLVTVTFVTALFAAAAYVSDRLPQRWVDRCIEVLR